MVSTDGLIVLEQTLDGIGQFFNQMGGVNIAIMFGFGVAIIILTIFKLISENLS